MNKLSRMTRQEICKIHDRAFREYEAGNIDRERMSRFSAACLEALRAAPLAGDGRRVNPWMTNDLSFTVDYLIKEGLLSLRETGSVDPVLMRIGQFLSSRILLSIPSPAADAVRNAHEYAFDVLVELTAFNTYGARPLTADELDY